LQPDVVKAYGHVHFTKGRASLEKGQVVKAIGDRDIAFRRAAQLFSAKKTMIKIDEFRRIFCEKSDVAKGCHGKPPPRKDWSNGVM